ncbi:histone H1 [Salmonella enterica subsp. enterica serovar Hadar]|nr:histone H1 [Salmonella enterica subsp. enterica serovar Hadar]
MTIYITELITGAIYTVVLFYWIKNEGDPDGHR